MGSIADLIRKPTVWAAGVFYILALFFRFALTGYLYAALFCAGVGTVLVLWAWLTSRRLYVLRRIMVMILIAAFAFLGAVEVPIVRASRGRETGDADWLIVLGCAVHGSTPSRTMTERVDAAADYLERHPDTVAVVSGGQGDGEDMTEADMMAQMLEDRGIAPGRILKEEQAESTAENLQYSLALTGGTGSYAIVSSEYHLCRASLLAHSLGIDADLIPAHTSYPVLRANYFLREAFGVVHFYVFGR